MADIVLTTLNAKYIHAAFGLRYLLANLGPLKSSACLLEFDINQRPNDIVEVLLARNPKIIGFGIYIWNVAPATEVVATIKRLRPGITIILGGPEVSYEVDEQPIVQLADYVITGEADLKFAELCSQLLSGEKPTGKIVPAELPNFDQLALPYELYNEQDVANRIIYVEASRGCPFSCEFCLSSLDIPVRQVPLPHLLDALQSLLERGVKHFKFVDRTFNLNISVSKAILDFFLERYQPGHFFHFEMVPDRLPEQLREVIAKFPAGALQFEVGIQTFNEEVGALIKRRQNYARLEENFGILRNQTGVHIHADLIAGLPGESLESFAAGFDRLIELAPQEIQVGILKRLRGTPIIRHDADWQMVYNQHPPYEILQTRLLDFATMQRLRRFSRYWDLVGNSGNFLESAPLLWRGQSSPFWCFMRWSEWLYARTGRTDSIALVRLMELLFEFLTNELKFDPQEVAPVLWRDYQRGGRDDKPAFLKPFLQPGEPSPSLSRKSVALPKRQARHLV
jgi:Fe-S oxidoreductase